ncbi:MAG: anthranilate phosphoribosyltransferase [Planctomycetes bacterium]|nr:anthranilate phosphoribosyltransferase [Planctomycetota bacterium]
MIVRDTLRRALRGQTFTGEETRELFVSIAHGDFEPLELSALLAALAARGETADEIAGAAHGLRETMLPFEHPFPDAIDTCGTGGDGLYTFNLSTAAAIVAAAAGARVVKHGNCAAASVCASADLLAAAGLPLDLTPAAAARVLEEVGITFLYAPRYHPALAAAASVRRGLGARTLLDLAAPLANPGRVRRQVLGVGGHERTERVAEALNLLGVERAYVLHGAGGADELTLAGLNPIVALGLAPTARFDARELAFAPASLGALAGGDPARNLALLERLLAGENGPIYNAVVLNASAALVVAGLATGPAEGAELARAALRRGAARRTFVRWIETANRLRGAA